MFVAAALLSLSSVKADLETAKVFVQNTANETLAFLNNKDVPIDTKKKEFEAIIDKNFNLKTIAKFVLARHWKQADEADRDEFISLFKTSMSSTYVNRFDEYQVDHIEVYDARDESDGGIMVQSKVSRPEGQDVRVDWKVFEKDGQFRVYDVLLDGISMSISLRSEYAAVIQKGNGQLSHLNNVLRAKYTE